MSVVKIYIEISSNNKKYEYMWGSEFSGYEIGLRKMTSRLSY